MRSNYWVTRTFVKSPNVHGSQKNRTVHIVEADRNNPPVSILGLKHTCLMNILNGNSFTSLYPDLLQDRASVPMGLCDVSPNADYSTWGILAYQHDYTDKRSFNDNITLHVSFGPTTTRFNRATGWTLMKGRYTGRDSQALARQSSTVFVVVGLYVDDKMFETFRDVLEKDGSRSLQSRRPYSCQYPRFDLVR